MLTETPEDRIAVLLSSLGMDISDPLFDTLPTEPRNRVRELIAEYQADPADEEEIDSVLNEFLRMLRFAKQNTPEPESESAQLKIHEPQEEQKQPEPDPTPQPKPEFKPSDDPFADLARLEPFQIAGALRAEQPRTAALILKCLPPNRAGEALQHFTPELQSNVFLLLKDPPTAPPALLERIVRATVDKGCQLGEEAVGDPEEESYKNLAEVLRAMSQSERARIMENLNETDPESIERLRKMMFVFDDIVRINDRCIQKMLTDVDSDTLAKALKNAPPEYLDKFANNLSKRARATLLEEIEFMASVKAQEEEEARNALCDVMSKLDQQGDLEFD